MPYLVSFVLVQFLQNWVSRQTRTSHRETRQTRLLPQLYHWWPRVMIRKSLQHLPVLLIT